MNNILINYQRLNRHYEYCLSNYDPVALLDLSHSLRMWVDMKDEVDEFLLDYPLEKSFSHYTFSKQFKRLLKRKEYLISFFTSDGVRTWAGSEEMTDNNPHSGIFNSPMINKDFIGELEFKKDIDKAFYVKRLILLIMSNETKEEKKVIRKGIIEKKSKTFSDWLNTEIIRFKINGFEKPYKSILTNQNIIKRVANGLGGSHPIGKDEYENELNQSIIYLMDFYFLGLPIPYFLTLKAAKEILEIITIKKEVE